MVGNDIFLARIIKWVDKNNQKSRQSRTLAFQSERSNATEHSEPKEWLSFNDETMILLVDMDIKYFKIQFLMEMNIRF
jgi:hypothetical protein